MNNLFEDVTQNYDSADINENKGLACLAYLGWLLIIPLFVKKESAFIKFHCNQGLILAIAGTIVSIITTVLVNMQLLGIIGVILGGLIGLPCTIVFGILTLVGIINAATGKALKFPVIGNITLIK